MVVQYLETMIFAIYGLKGGKQGELLECYNFGFSYPEDGESKGAPACVSVRRGLIRPGLSGDVGIQLTRTEANEQRRMFVPTAQRSRKEIKNATGKQRTS